MTRRVSPDERPRPKRVKREPPRLLGWREWIALPDLGVVRIKAKLDTGARTSSLHVSDLERFKRRGKHMARFTIHPVQRQAKPSIACEVEILEERHVRSSSGHAETRPVILTAMEVLGTPCMIEVTLASRDDMGFRMLLGRGALRRLFDVSPGRSFLSDAPGPPPRRLKKRTKKRTKKSVKKRRKPQP